MAEVWNRNNIHLGQWLTSIDANPYVLLSPKNSVMNCVLCDCSHAHTKQLQGNHSTSTETASWEFWCFLLTYILSLQPRKVTICGRHIMASVQDIQITEALFILCLAYYVMKRVRHRWNWGIMTFTYWDMRHTFYEYILRIFRNGWMVQRCSLCCSLLILLCNRQIIVEYKVYWLMGFPIIYPWGARFMTIFFVFSIMPGWIAEMLFM